MLFLVRNLVLEQNSPLRFSADTDSDLQDYLSIICALIIQLYARNW